MAPLLAEFVIIVIGVLIEGLTSAHARALAMGPASGRMVFRSGIYSVANGLRNQRIALRAFDEELKLMRSAVQAAMSDLDAKG